VDLPDSPYDSQRSHPSMDLGVKWDLCVLFVQTTVKSQDCKFVWANCTVYCSNKMLQRLAVTNPKNDKMDPHGVNPTLSIFSPTPFPVAMQGLGATTPWEKDLRIPCLEIIVLTNWKTTFTQDNLLELRYTFCNCTGVEVVKASLDLTGKILILIKED
jgi:hypothetical protein